jgi:copper(I)-binding protein
MRLAPSSRRRNGPAANGLTLAAILALLTGTAIPASADEGGMTLSNAWVRSVVPSRPAAGYFTLKNETGKDHKIVSASSPDCGMLMLHRSEHNGGEHMVMVDSVDVPAGGSVSFAPGGYHLMCVKPGDGVKPGKSIRITLTFDDGGTLTADFKVRNAKGE